MNHTIGNIKLQFKMPNENLARSFQANWEIIFHCRFEKITDKILSKYDQQEEIIEILELTLDLGTVSEVYFEENWLSIYEEKLNSEMIRLFSDPENDISKNIEVKALNAFEMLCRFLLTGTIPSAYYELYQDLNILFLYVLKTHGKKLKLFLIQYGHYSSLQERVVYQFNDEILERGIALLKPESSVFICSYVKLLLKKYKEIREKPVQENNFRKAVWLLIYAYILTDKSSYFNKKRFVMQTVDRLAAQYNWSYHDLLKMLNLELEQHVKQYHIPEELFKILLELNTELKTFESNKLPRYASYYLKNIAKSIGKQINTTSLIQFSDLLRDLLSKEDRCRSFLQYMKEYEIIQLVYLIIPKEATFVVGYAQYLDQQKEKNLLEGKIGNEFYLLKWQIILPLLLKKTSSTFQRKQFVWQVIQSISRHYNIEIKLLLFYFCRELTILKIDKELIEILDALSRLYAMPSDLSQMKNKMDFDERIDRFEQFVIANMDPLIFLIQQEQILTEQQQAFLYKILSKSKLRSKLIERVKEELLFKILFFCYKEEALFIIAYSKQLDVQAERGVLEGKTGGSFRQLKWNFILHYLSEYHHTFFHEEKFVETILRKLAHHYNVHYFDLLSFFYHEIHFHGERGRLKEIFRKLYHAECLGYAQLLLLNTHQDMERFQLLQLLFPKEKEFVIQYHQWLKKEASKQDFLEGKSGTEFTQLKWQFILSVLIEMPRRSFNKIHFVYQVLSRLAAHYNLKIESLIDYFNRNSTSYAGIFGMEMQKILKSLYLKYRPFLQTNDSSIADNLMQKERAQNRVSIEQESIMINNAGLVILSPLLPHFFKLAELLSPQGQFKDRNAQMRALYLIQYLVYGHTDFPEYAMNLNKLLIGFKIIQPIPFCFQISEKEKYMTNSLLLHIIAQWEKIKNSSIQGLRESFLQREGRLEASENGYHLMVANRAYDMLLDYFPWFIHSIKYTWMEKEIIVHWRN